MSNRDNGQELDFYELRRRHQEYKARTKSTQASSPAPKPRPATRPAPEPKNVLDPDEIQDAPADIDVRPPVEEDPLANLVLDDEEDYEDDIDYEDDAQAANPNPFDSFIRFFNGVKETISARRLAREEAELEALDDLTDEELAELEAEESENGADDRPISRRERRAMRRQTAAEDIESDDFDDIDEDFEDLDEDLEDGEDFEDDELEDDTPGNGIMKRILGLFVERVDEDDSDDDTFEDDEFEDEEFEDEDFEDIAEEFPYAPAGDVRSKPEGGQIMDDLNKTVPDSIQQESGGMTRRERRERAMRLAAEEAARKAAEEKQAAEEAARKAAEEAQAAEEAASAVILAEPAPAEDIEPKDKEDVPAQDEAPFVEEPTREFLPVNARGAKADKQTLFEPEEEEEIDEDEEDYEDDEDDTPRRGFFGLFLGRKRAKDEDEDDEDEDLDDEDDDDGDEDEDEDERPAKSRFSLFGRRKKGEDEEDDEEDVDEENSDEDEEDESPAKPRFSLFSRGKKVDDDDDDEDEDDEDEDDDEEEDEYGEYEDDEEDEDEYEYDYDYDDEDDDEVHHSIGYHIVGVLKWSLRIIFALLIVAIVLNFMYFFGNDNIVPAMHDAMGDSTSFRLLFFSYYVRGDIEQNAPTTDFPAESAEPAFFEDPANMPEAEATPEPTPEVPNFDTDGAADNIENIVGAVSVEAIEDDAPVGGSIG